MSPLFISRVETVVSLQQLEAREGEPAPACEGHELQPDAPVAGIAWSRLPKYSYPADASPKVARVSSINDFARVPDIDSDSSSSGAAGAGAAPGAGSSSQAAARAALAAALAADGPQRFGLGGDSDEDCGSSCEGSVLDAGCVPAKSLLDAVLLAMWEERAEQGLFRYDVTACPTKVVPGQYGFVAQLNEGRYSKKRPTEFRVDQVVQAFDPAKFNFTKALQREVLFAFEPAPASAPGARFEDAGRAPASPSVVLINVSPIEYGHVLLCPRVLDCIPQLLDVPTCLAALHFALEVGNPYLRVGFNSLGAFATINHLHFQAYYLNAPLPCERAPTVPLPASAWGEPAKRRRPDSGLDRVSISRLADYPVRGWVVEGPSLAAMAQVVGDAAAAMQAAAIPHNVLISDCGGRVFIWPQAYAEKQALGQVPESLLDVGVNPAVWEIAGHLVLKRGADYAGFTEDAAWELLAAVSLSEAQLEVVGRHIFAGAPLPGGSWSVTHCYSGSVAAGKAAPAPAGPLPEPALMLA